MTMQLILSSKGPCLEVDHLQPKVSPQNDLTVWNGLDITVSCLLVHTYALTVDVLSTVIIYNVTTF